MSSNNVHRNRRYAHPQSRRTRSGFTLLEVLVALVIVGTALGASLRAVGGLTQNSSGLRLSMMATWSAENRLTHVRLAGEWPPLGKRAFDCPQADLALVCEEDVTVTLNPYFRKVEVSVFEANTPERRIIKLTQVVPNNVQSSQVVPNVPPPGDPNNPQPPPPPPPPPAGGAG
jgi:general secretion pathway protein I